MRIFIARIKKGLKNAEIAAQRAFSAPFMSARQQGPYDTIARKWLALAERRRAHLIELRDSGRWERYYGKGDLADELLVLERACRRLAEVAGSEPEPEAAAA